MVVETEAVTGAHNNQPTDCSNSDRISVRGGGSGDGGSRGSSSGEGSNGGGTDGCSGDKGA
jgi:hypothetical protein